MSEYGDLDTDIVRVQVLKYLSKILYLRSLEDVKGAKFMTLYLHRVLLESGIFNTEDLLQYDFKELEEAIDGSEVLIKSAYNDRKGVIRRGVYRVSLDVKDNVITLGKKKFQQNLNYTYLNSPSGDLMREWEEQETGSDYPEGEGSGSPASFWDYPKDEYLYSDWSGSRGYLVDYDFDHYDDHLWEE